MKKYLNAELANTLGNLLNRVTSVSINPFQIYPSHSLLSSSTELVDQCVNLPLCVTKAYDSYRFYHGIIAIMDVLRTCNSYVQHEQPWVLVKSTIKSDQDRLQALIYLTLECLRICGILLQPIVPSLTKQLLDILEIDPDQRKLHNCTVSNEHYEKKLNIVRDQRAILYRRLEILDRDISNK